MEEQGNKDNNIDREKVFNDAVDRLNQASSLLNSISLKLTPIIDIVMKLQSTVEYMQKDIVDLKVDKEDHCNILHRDEDSVIIQLQRLKMENISLKKDIDDVKKSFSESKEQKNKSLDRNVVIWGIVLNSLISIVALFLQIFKK